MEATVWEWQLPSGERVVAHIDRSSGTESVFLGRRLVSRAIRGFAPRGHQVLVRGAVGGAYRGLGDVRVFFDGPDSRLLIDGKVLTVVERRLSAVPFVTDALIARFERRRAIFNHALTICLSGIFVAKLFKHETGLWTIAISAAIAVSSALALASLRCPACGERPTWDARLSRKCCPG
jgi:hypothetical protein